jgi:hypothetical protein
MSDRSDDLNLEPVEAPDDHECPDPPAQRGDTTAAGRGWGQGWPADNKSKMTTVRAGGIAVSVHTAIAPLVTWLIEQTVAKGYGVRHGECWGFANRAIRGTNQPSNHSWGLAVDLNAPANPMTDRLVTDMPAWMPALWKSKQFRWGGDYPRRKDAMHYEFMGTPDDARRLAAELGGAVQTAKAAPAGGTRPTLKKGAKGDAVVILQQRLNAGGAKLTADGVFGAKTDQALRAFQKQRGLEVDGICGPRTWAALG